MRQQDYNTIRFVMQRGKFEDYIKNPKEYQNLKKEVNSILRDFQKNKQWADFSNWLHKLHEQLNKKNYHQLPHSITLAKRLAQCLNPALPAGVHTTALKVYQVVLNRFTNKTQLLPLISLGLFPFFEHSTNANKLILLKIFDEHLVSETQVVQMVVGLTNALLTGLNENNQELAKRIYALWEKISRQYGRMWVDGAVWINILKSPKVRLAGFKYFMKVFKDRDKMQNNSQEDTQEEARLWTVLRQQFESSQLKEQQMVLLSSLFSCKKAPDDHKIRFPNFSSLIVNTLCVCLEPNADNMLKRSALDLMANYLRLDNVNNKEFGRREAVVLVTRMLLLLQSKQYNLTNRVYKYLFDQPNAEGQFVIDVIKKKYQLEILKEALLCLLEEGNENILLIIQYFMADHPALIHYLLANLSYQLIRFIRTKVTSKDKNLPKYATDFYLNVITKHRKIIVQAMIDKMIELHQSSNKNFRAFDQALQVLQFYFSKMQALTPLNRRKGSGQAKASFSMPDIDEYVFIRGLAIKETICFLTKNKTNQSTILASLQLCNQLASQCSIATRDNIQDLMSPQTVEQIEFMLNKEAKSQRKVIFSRLITLLPQSKKEMLLPHIQDSSLSVVCIGLLLGHRRKIQSSSRKISIKASRGESFIGDFLPLEKVQQQKLFRAIFKLLNCHLFQTSGLQFIDRFRTSYPETFSTLIDTVEPSEWLIYWRKLDGNVAGGILRMIQNVQSRDSYHQHLSRKWVRQAQTIISKVIDPIYNLMDKSQRKTSFQDQEAKEDGQRVIQEWNTDEYQRVFRLISIIFRSTSRNFSKYFYLLKEKYLHTLILYIFKSMENGQFQVRSKSLRMLSFLLQQTSDLNQKFDVVQLTLPNAIDFLNKAIDSKKSSQDNDSAQRLLEARNIQIELLEYVGKIVAIVKELTKLNKPQLLIKTLEQCKVYEVVLRGMAVTETPYIRTLYLDGCKQIAQMLFSLDSSKQQLALFTSSVLQRLFSLLKISNMGEIQELVKGRRQFQGTHRKRSATIAQDHSQSVMQEPSRAALNLQDKYIQIIQLWNSIKFYIQFAVKAQLPQIPIHDLLNIILESFPLFSLTYTAAGSVNHQANLQILQDEINNITGLKKEVLQIFEILWNKQSRQIMDLLIEKGDPRILIHGRLEPGRVLETFNQNSKIKQVLRYTRGKFNLPKTFLHYNLDTLVMQNKLLYFLYLYLLYCNMRLLKNRRISVFFDTFLQLFNAVKSSPHVQTKLWMLQLLDLLSQRMLNSKDIHFQGWTKIKSQLQSLVKQLLESNVEIITKSKQFTHKVQIKTGIFNFFNKGEQQSSLYDFIEIFPPTVFQLYQKYQAKCKLITQSKLRVSDNRGKNQQERDYEQPRDRLAAYMMQEDNILMEKQSKLDQILFSSHLNITHEIYVNYLSVCSLKSLIRIGNFLLLSLFDKDFSKVCIIIKEILMNLLPLCENRQPQNQLFNQLVAQYLHALLQQEQVRPELVKVLRKPVLQSFMANDFFKCTQRTLAHWRAVIDYCTQGYDLLGELLEKQGLLQGIFTKKSQQTRQKIKSFERLCFVIYSGKVDKYQKKLKIVLQSLNQVMKKETPEPSLLILILFCIRILLMRLSAVTLNKLFKSVWPSLITLLIQIFKKEKAGRSHNLKLAAFKVIELVHALQLQEFMFHKWMFIFDYFGLKIEPMGDIQDNMQQCQILTPFVFKPYISEVLPNNRLRCKFMPEVIHPDLVSHSLLARRLIVKKPTVKDEDQLKQMGVLLMQYMMDLNENRCQVSKSDIENLIEEDFISLDDYIFKMK